MQLNLSADHFSCTTVTIAVAALVVARLIYCAALRYQLFNRTDKLFAGRYALNEEDVKAGLPRMNKSGLRGVRDAQYIFNQMATLDMPFVTQKALEFALFKTYGIPSISKILLRTGQFVKDDKASRRYVDTAVLIGSFIAYPLPPLDLEDNDVPSFRGQKPQDFADPRGAVALARTNFLHARANKINAPHGAGISNDDLLYTLSVFVLVPPEWYVRAGFRPASPLELEALYTVFYHVGQCMGIQVIPDTLQELAAWSEAYERKAMVFAPQNNTVAVKTVELLLWHVPEFARPPLFHVISALLDTRLRTALGMVTPAAWLEIFLGVSLKAFGLSVRLFATPRSKPLTLAPTGSDNILEGALSGGVCPASGAKAEEGRKCPVGDHGAAAAVAGSAKPRLYPNWVDNDPHYMPASKPWTLHWLFERAFVPAEKRYGARRWGGGEGATGYRLEECGPKGLESIGRAEVIAGAEKLMGKPLEGPWAPEVVARATVKAEA